METGGKSRKGARGRKGGGGPKKKSVNRSIKAGLQFPVRRISQYLKKGHYFQRARIGALVYLTVMLEYLAAEVLRYGIDCLFVHSSSIVFCGRGGGGVHLECIKVESPVWRAFDLGGGGGAGSRSQRRAASSSFFLPSLWSVKLS